MIDVMNLLDGDATPGRIDERMLVVFGNHEFDSESCGAPPYLQARVAESDFLWLSSNVAPGRCPDGRPRLTGVNVLDARIVDVGGIRVGLFGLTIPIPHKDVAFLDPLATATALTADLRRRGAEVVIAVTHLPKEEDERIYAASSRARSRPDRRRTRARAHGAAARRHAAHLQGRRGRRDGVGDHAPPRIRRPRARRGLPARDGQRDPARPRRGRARRPVAAAARDGVLRQAGQAGLLSGRAPGDDPHAAHRRGREGPRRGDVRSATG